MKALSALVLGVLLAVGSATASAAAVPSGEFVVVAAPRHPAVTNLQGAFRPNDPQLVGRLVSFDGSALSFDGDYTLCERASNSTATVPAGKLIRGIFPDRLAYGKHYTARPSDFGLTIKPAEMVAATSFRCVVPHGNHGADWTGATLFPLGDGRWALSLVKDHLLILTPAAGPIRASFNCARARSVVERTICGDRLLAGWDRSVTTAYEQGNGDQITQRAWLIERDKCGADKSCLHDSLSLRVINLLQ